MIPVSGFKAIGTALVPREGQISTSSPARNRCCTSLSAGLPVCGSMPVAQFTLTYACAAISLQLVRSSTYMNPFRSEERRVGKECRCRCGSYYEYENIISQYKHEYIYEYSV